MKKEKSGKFFKYNAWGYDHELHVVYSEYVYGGTAIQLMDVQEENGIEWEEPYMTASVWVDGLNEDEVAIKNYSENEGILDVLVKEGVITEPHRFVSSGFVEIPVCYLKESEKQ